LLDRFGSRFEGPSIVLNAEGNPRRVGVEVEFMGLSPRWAAQALAGGLGGHVKAEDTHAYTIHNSRLGDLTVELDLRHVHPQRHDNTLPIRLGARGAAWLGFALGSLVPRELITGPLAFCQLPQVDDAIRLLRHAGARGDGAILSGSLGLHFNIEPPALDARTVTLYLKAFLVLNERLRCETARQSRRLRWALPPNYPVAYVSKVLAPDYSPDLAGLTADYLAANPTRKRALDLLPLLAHFDEARVRSALPHEKIGRRSVFHYRLPQAHISDPKWSIASDWNRWIAVEKLANDWEQLSRLLQEMALS
jgi:hypothetical protein